MVHYFSMSSVHSENLAEQVAQLDHFFNEYNSEAMQSSGAELHLPTSLQDSRPAVDL